MIRLINQLKKKLHFAPKPPVTKLIDKVIISAKFTLNTAGHAWSDVHTNRQSVTKAPTLFRPTKKRKRKKQIVFDDKNCMINNLKETFTNFKIILLLKKYVCLFACVLLQKKLIINSYV